MKGAEQLNKIQSEIDSISEQIKPLNTRIIPDNINYNMSIIHDIVILDIRRKELQKRKWNVLQYIKRVN